MNRAERLVSFARLDGVGLEIGPLDKPLVKRESDRRIFYADYTGRSELVRKSAGDPNVNCDAIPEIDYIVSTLADYGRIAQKFDYIIASHVIEHTPDVLGWLEAMQGLLNPVGRLILAVPDRRYMFDYFRNESTVGDALEAYYEGRSKPSFRQVFDGHGGARKVNIVDLWEGRVPVDPEKYFDLKTVLTIAQSGKYSDCHCWVFTHVSFLSLLDTVCSLGVLNMSIVASSEPIQHSNEFHIVLSPAQR